MQTKHDFNVFYNANEKITQEWPPKKFRRMLLNSLGFSIWGTWDASLINSNRAFLPIILQYVNLKNTSDREYLTILTS